KEIGNQRNLAIGIAVAPSKANLWALIDAATTFMNRAKRKARELILKNSCESTICFDVIESGDLSSSTVNERFETLEKRKLTSQPYRVSEIEDLIRKLMIEKIIYKSYLASRVESLEKADIANELRKTRESLKKIRGIINEVLSAAKLMISKAEFDSPYIFPIAYIYAMRQILRKDESSKLEYDVVSSAIPSNLDDSSKLSDIDRLIKIIGGGMI
ncbi:MAG: hypothetical protein N3D72_02875, partial [Candidatus Methanomethyliaceae archaeon]|nr:hypothetical protein [Candidatus Methanomethyliaceae archaeon]